MVSGKSLTKIAVASLLLLTAPIYSGALVPSAGPAVDPDSEPAVPTVRSGTIQPTDSGPAASVTVTHSSDRPLEVAFALEYSIPENASTLTVSIPDDARVVETERFERNGTAEYRWTGDGRTASLTFATNVTDYQDPTGWPSGAEVVGTAGWILTKAPDVRTVWEFGNERASRSPFERAESDAPSILAADEVVVGERLLYVGPHERFTRNESGQTFHLIRPRAAELDHDPDSVLASLAAASEDLRVGDRDRSVLVFAAPDPVRSGGYAYDDEFVVAAGSSSGSGASLDSANNLWIHEYVHTRQSLSLAPETAWFREASAEYYGALLSFEQERVDARDALGHLRPDPEYCAQPLSSTGADPDPRLEYRKGSAVLYALDERIREATEHRRSLIDVFRRVNEASDVDLADFGRIVANVSGRSMDDWIDRHVAGDECPPLDDANASVLSGDGRIHAVSIRDGARGDGGADDHSIAVNLTVRADTTLGDAVGDGEPRLRVAGGNFTVRTVEDLDRGTNVERTVALSRRDLSWYRSPESTLNLSVELREGDPVDDAVDVASLPLSIGPTDPATLPCSHSIDTPTLRLENATDRDGDGRCAGFAVDVRIDGERADGYDVGSGEPFAVVAVDGDRVARTTLSPRGDVYESTVPLSASDLRGEHRGERSVSVTVLDDDVLFDDRIASWNFSVATESVSGDGARNATAAG